MLLIHSSAAIHSAVTHDTDKHCPRCFDPCVPPFPERRAPFPYSKHVSHKIGNRRRTTIPRQQKVEAIWAVFVGCRGNRAVDRSARMDQ